MPSPLATNASVADVQAAMQPLTTAIVNGHGTRVLDWTKAVFGAEVTETAVQERKDEMKGMQMNGSFGETGNCTCLLRSYVVLRDRLGEQTNAEELKRIANEMYPRELVQSELARVENGL